MGEQHHSDDALAEVKAILGRLQRISHGPGDDDLAGSSAPLEAPAPVTDGVLSVRTLVLVVPLAVVVAGGAFVTGMYLRSDAVVAVTNRGTAHEGSGQGGRAQHLPERSAAVPVDLAPQPPPGGAQPGSAQPRGPQSGDVAAGDKPTRMIDEYADRALAEQISQVRGVAQVRIRGEPKPSTQGPIQDPIQDQVHDQVHDPGKPTAAASDAREGGTHTDQNRSGSVQPKAGEDAGRTTVADRALAQTSPVRRAADLMASGQVQAARAALLGAADHDSADIAFALARSYDRNYLASVPGADAAPDVAEARRWYGVWYDIAVRQGLVSDSVPLERIIRSLD